MAAGASLLAAEVFGSTGESALEASKRWFRQAQYGMMVHWGLYSLVGGEWKGKRMDNRYIGEWAQQYFRIPNAEYASLAKAFNPIFFNADEGAVERPLRSRLHPAAGLSHQFADRMRNLRLHVRRGQRDSERRQVGNALRNPRDLERHLGLQGARPELEERRDGAQDARAPEAAGRELSA